MRKVRGQALVEMALVLPILLLVLVAASDLLPLAGNALIGKSLTARGARAAALSSRPDGVVSCQTRVSGVVANTPFYLSDWSWSTSSNCSADPTVGIAQGEAIQVYVDLTYHALWFGELELSIGTEDYGR